MTRRDKPPSAEQEAAARDAAMADTQAALEILRHQDAGWTALDPSLETWDDFDPDDLNGCEDWEFQP